MNLEAIDRRAFLFGMTVTAAGLLVPKPVMVAVPEQVSRFAGVDIGMGAGSIVWMASSDGGASWTEINPQDFRMPETSLVIRSIVNPPPLWKAMNLEVTLA